MPVKLTRIRFKAFLQSSNEIILLTGKNAVQGNFEQKEVIAWTEQQNTLRMLLQEK